MKGGFSNWMMIVFIAIIVFIMIFTIMFANHLSLLLNPTEGIEIGIIADFQVSSGGGLFSMNSCVIELEDGKKVSAFGSVCSKLETGMILFKSEHDVYGVRGKA